MLNRVLSILLLVQISLCVLSLGFTPAILLAFALMIAAPVSFLRSMAAHGVAFVLVPGIVGALVLEEGILTPVILGWFVLVIVASVICLSRASGKPQFSASGSR
jgi:hypothetical protein